LCDTQLLHGLIDSSGGCWAGGLVSKFFLHFFHQVLCADVVGVTLSGGSATERDTIAHYMALQC